METEGVLRSTAPSRRGGILRAHGSSIAVIQQALDVAVALACLLVLVLIKHLGAVPDHYQLLALVAGALIWVTYQWSGVYVYRRTVGLLEEVAALARPWFLVFVLLTVLGFITKTSALFSREVLLAWAVLGFAAQIGVHGAVRYGLRTARANGRNIRRAILIGTKPLAQAFADRIAANPWLGIKVIGCIEDAHWERRRRAAPISVDRRRRRTLDAPASIRMLGSTEALAAVLKRYAPDQVYITLPNYSAADLAQLYRTAMDSNIDIHWVPDLSNFVLVNHCVRELDGQPILCLSDSPMHGPRFAVKWLEDKILAVIFLVLLAVPMAIIALGVKLSSPGPVLFKQRRHGLDGSEFVLWKFRTMRPHIEVPGSVTQARMDDARVTRFGAFLRRTSLDELPQFINVLQGRMSIVGPRPHAIEHNNHYRQEIEAYMLRHRIKPGITGWAQVNGWRGQTETVDKMAERLRYDMYYLNNWSVWFDMRIILMTIREMASGRNAY